MITDPCVLAVVYIVAVVWQGLYKASDSSTWAQPSSRNVHWFLLQVYKSTND